MSIRKNLYERTKKTISSFSNTTALLAAILCAVLGGVVHPLIAGQSVIVGQPGASHMIILAGIWSLLSFLIILNRWSRFRVLSLIILPVASYGMSCFSLWILLSF
jgi:hypothetical protein